MAVDPALGIFAGVKDMATQERAEQEAMRVLKAKRPNAKGEIYLSWSGTGCGAMRAVSRQGRFSVMGFGLQRTLSDAQLDAIAHLKKHRPDASIDQVFDVCNTPTPGKTVAYELIIAQDLEPPEDKECYLQYEVKLTDGNEGGWSAYVRTPPYQVGPNTCPLVDRKSPYEGSGVFYHDTRDDRTYVGQNAQKDPSGRATKLLADFASWLRATKSPIAGTSYHYTLTLRVAAPKTQAALDKMIARVASVDPGIDDAMPGMPNPCLGYTPPANSVGYGKHHCKWWVKP